MRTFAEIEGGNPSVADQVHPSSKNVREQRPQRPIDRGFSQREPSRNVSTIVAQSGRARISAFCATAGGSASPGEGDSAEDRQSPARLSCLWKSSTGPP